MQNFRVEVRFLHFGAWYNGGFTPQNGWSSPYSPHFTLPRKGVLHIFGAKWSKTRREGFQISTYCPIFVVYYKTSKNGRQ